MGLNLFASTLMLFSSSLFLTTASSNSTNKLKISDKNYSDWLRRMSWRNHSDFVVEAKNKFEPCKKIKVHKNPKLGDFTTVKKAIASIPLFNPCRVVISVGPGTYW